MPKPWTVIDFILVVLGGFLGAGIFVALSLLWGGGELLLVLGLAGQYLGHLGALWLLSRTKSHPDLGFSIEGGDIRYLGLGLLLQLALALLFLPLATYLLPDGESVQEVGSALAGLESTAARVAAIVVAVVVAPVTEELTFRGVLLKAMGDRSRRTIIVVTSLVFAAFHVLGLDPARFVQAAAVVLPQLFIVGMALAWVTLRTNRLGPAIFMHSGFNLLASIVLLVPSELLETGS
ncbi:MAG TPA: CPBP family intramembrane glutamic endopeptidase [Acidimicrobiia bacterium]|nr:CPBP family intramembrane glutamic endopeptidase [Acidimicrobiia bacterium]